MRLTFYQKERLIDNDGLLYYSEITLLFINFFFLLSLIAWVGSILFFSLVATPTLFMTLPPEHAGKAVSALFPKYFPVGYISGFVALGFVLISSFKTGHWPYLKILLLLGMLTLTIHNSLITYPRAHALKEEMHEATSETEMADLKTEFNRSHKISVINNGAVLILGLLLVAATAKGLKI